MHTQTRILLLCSYDSDADAAYIYLDHPIPPAAAQRVIPFDPDQGMFNHDLNPEGHVIGLEILGAHNRLPPALLQAILNSQDQTNNKP
ncbi:DUF2283 domain-containing protein [Micromonospora sp. NPDC004551]|uniref:DUF2283 domain-containing protein n=1 Tax=Micromonospora sp. NPDC004551 TaxID=3154284 RepID=UPI0033ACC65C